MLKLTLMEIEDKSKLVYINPRHIVSIQVAQQGCLVNTVRGTYHVRQTADHIIEAASWVTL